MMKRNPTSSKKHISDTTMTKYMHILPTISCFALGAFVAYKMNTTQVRHLEPVFVSADSGAYKVYVNTRNIRWMLHDLDTKCFQLCTNDRGCFLTSKIDDKYTVCDNDHPRSYHRLAKLIKENE